VSHNTKVLLRRGQVFPVSVWAQIGAVTNLVVGAFGTGPRPILRWAGPNSGGIIRADNDSDGVLIQDMRLESPYGPDDSQVEAIALDGRTQTVWSCEFGDFENWVDATSMPTGVFVVDATGGAARSHQFSVIATDGVFIGIRAAESRQEHIVRVMPRSSTGQPSARISFSFCDLDQHGVGGKGPVRLQAVQFGTLFHDNLLNGRTDMGHDDGDCDHLVLDGCLVTEEPGALALALHHNVRGMSFRNNTFRLASAAGKAIGTFLSATFSGQHGAEDIDLFDNEFEVMPRPGHSYIVNLNHSAFDVTNISLRNNRFQVPTNFNKHFIEFKRESDLAEVQGNAYTNLGASFDYHDMGGSGLNWGEWVGLAVTQNEALLPP
jgi:hypothetical protein